MEFPRKLRQRMQSLRLSQQRVAEELGCSQNLVSRWCRGQNTPDIFQAAALARVLHVPLAYLGDEADLRTAEEVEQEMKALAIVDEIGWAEAFARLIGRTPAPGGYEQGERAPIPPGPGAARRYGKSG